MLIAIVYDALMMTIYKKRIYRHVLSQMSTKPLALRGQKSLVQYAIYKGKPSHVGTLLEKGQVFLCNKRKFLFSVDSFGENILTLLLNDGAHDESGLEKRKKCLLWLKDNKDEALGKIISTRNCSGSNAMSLVGNFDWGSDEEKDQMISWLLSKGANITHMNSTEAEAYLDR